MPPQALAPDTLPADFFSKAPPDTLPADFRFDEASSSSKPKSDGFFLNLAHQWLKNQMAAADGSGMGTGGVIQNEQPPKEFHWSDVQPSLRNAVRATADELKQLWPNAGAGVANLLTAGATMGAAKRPFSPDLPLTPGAGASAAVDTARSAGAAVVRGAAKGTNAALSKAPGAVGAAAGAAVGHAVGAPGIGTALGYGIGREVLPTLKVPGENFGIKPQIDALSQAAAQPQTPISAQQAMQAQIARMRGQLPPGPTELPPSSLPVQPGPAPAWSPTTRAERLGLLLPENAGGRIALPESTATPEVPAQGDAAGYPGGLQKRPTSRAEIVDDKAVQDQMRHDLDKNGWNALSEEKQKYYADNAPQMTKAQIIAHAQAGQIMQEATVKVQQILEQARVKAETPARFTKTVIPKAPTPASTVGLDVNQDLTDILQRSLDAINAKKGQ